MPFEIVVEYTRKMIRGNPKKFFVFGDNCHRTGVGGQARETRGEPNTIGIRTKKAPTYEPSDYFTDDEYALNVQMIMEDFEPILRHLYHGRTIVWPADGVGTGRALLLTKAPFTLKFINDLTDSLKELYGEKT